MTKITKCCLHNIILNDDISDMLKLRRSHKALISWGRATVVAVIMMVVDSSS